MDRYIITMIVKFYGSNSYSRFWDARFWFIQM